MPTKEKKVGLINGNFYPCPKKHYCVSSQSAKDNLLNHIEPIKYNLSLEEAKEKIKKVINSIERTKLLNEEDYYLHYLFITRLIRFKDDVEFLFDDNEKIIHIRSQSRIGGYDWNTNRNRLEKIRRLFHTSK